MKKVLIGSALAVSLLFAGTSQSLAATTQGTGVNVDLSYTNIETALQMVQQQRTSLLHSQLQTVRNLDDNQIDSLNNKIQMDMLRLQSLSDKHNEAFDVMTNLIKKMQVDRTSILVNMR